MRQTMVKAVPVNGLVQFVRNELSPDAVKSLEAQMGDEAKCFTGHLLATDQVPVAIVNRFTVLAAKLKGESVSEFGRRAGRFGAEIGIRSVYRFLLMVMSVESVLKKAPLMWSRVYDGGSIVVEPGKQDARISVRDFPSEEAGCARITGWFELIGERAGARNLKVTHGSCMARGAAECVWDFVWQ